jgi:hypothetical protein
MAVYPVRSQATAPFYHLFDSHWGVICAAPISLLFSTPLPPLNVALSRIQLIGSRWIRIPRVPLPKTVPEKTSCTAGNGNKSNNLLLPLICLHHRLQRQHVST